MKQTLSTTITKGSQITLPARMQRALGIRPGDRVTLTIDEQSITIRPQPYALRDVFGSVKARTSDDPGDFDQRIHDAMENGLADSAPHSPRL